MSPGLRDFAAEFAIISRQAGALRRAPDVPSASPALWLLGPGVAPQDLGSLPGSVPTLSAERILSLLQPDLHDLPESPEEIARRFRAALPRDGTRTDLLALALEALPEDAMDERRFLSRALTYVLGQPRHRSAPRSSSTPSPGLRFLQDVASENDDPHALLDRCWEIFADWRREQEGSFEVRSSQVEMAHSVLEALLNAGTVVIEAGPGTGKSLAYALPAVLVALRDGARVALSTQTRNLQEQLVRRDLPALWDCFGLSAWKREDGGRGLRFAKLLGRNNYVCFTALRRWIGAIRAGGGSFSVAQLTLAMMRFPAGCLEDLEGIVSAADLENLRSSRETCIGSSCRGDPPCPVYGARETARRADVLVVNHALLCADGRLQGTLLGDRGALVVDEAHELERVGTEASALRLGPGGAETLQRAVRRLESELREPAAAVHADALRPAWGRLEESVTRVRRGLEEAFSMLDRSLPMDRRDPSRQRYRDADEVFGGIRPQVERLRGDVARLVEAAELFVETSEEALLDAGTAGVLELAHVILDQSREIGAAFSFLQRSDVDDWVMFLDFGSTGGTLREIVAIPLDVGAVLQELLARPERGVVYTSATLCLEGDASYVRRRLGVDSSVPIHTFPSPFDYARQCTVACTASLGDYRDPGFLDETADVAAALHAATGRRMLMLLTSNQQLRGMYAALRTRLGAEAPLLAQGISGSRQEVAERLIATPGGILLGTSSFWTGVDFPGESLEILLLPKLPFAPPDDPLVEARCERLRAAGEDAFEDFILPEALLRFRQGVGRLIRSNRDRGAVILLDGRIETRAYGERFLSALPTGVQRFESLPHLVSHVRHWFDGAAGAAGEGAREEWPLARNDAVREEK